MSKTIFEYDYFVNGQVLYPAGVPIESTEHTKQLIADGVAGREIEAEEPAQA